MRFKKNHKPDRLNEILPYQNYDKETNLFCDDKLIGFMLEIKPLASCYEYVIKTISKFICEKMPEGNDWNFSFSMVGEEIDAVSNLKNYRAFFSCSSVRIKDKARIISFKKDLICFVKKVFNDFKVLDQEDLKEYVDIIACKNKLGNEKDIEFKQESNFISCNNKKVVGMSLMALPVEIGLWQIPDLFAGCLDRQAEKLNPSVLTINFNVQPLEQSKNRSIHELRRAHKISYSHMRDMFPSIDEDISQWQEIVKNQHHGECKFVNMTMDIMIFSDEDNYFHDTDEYRSTFEKKGFRLSDNQNCQYLSLFNTLPFATHKITKYLKLCNRVHVVTATNIANLLPIISDGKGALNKNGLLLPTFRNQEYYFNPFTAESPSVLITGGDGAGKSVLQKEIIKSHAKLGDKIFIVAEFDEYLNGNVIKADQKINLFSLFNQTKKVDIEHISILADLLSDFAKLDKSDSSKTLINNIGLSKFIEYKLEEFKSKYTIKCTLDKFIEFIRNDVYLSEVADALDKQAKILNKTYATRSYDNQIELSLKYTDEPNIYSILLTFFWVYSESYALKGRKLMIIDIDNYLFNAIKNESQNNIRLLTNNIFYFIRLLKRVNVSVILSTNSSNDDFIKQIKSCCGVNITMKQAFEFDEFIKTGNGANLSEYEQNIIHSFDSPHSQKYASMMIKTSECTTFNKLYSKQITDYRRASA